MPEQEPLPLPPKHAGILAQELLHGRLVLFVGAGLSRLAPAKDGSDRRLPLWKELTEQVARACQENPADYNLDPLDLFDAVVYGQQRFTLEQAVCAALDDKAFQFSTAHEALKELPWAAVVTTNYDGLLQCLLDEEPVYEERDYDRLTLPLGQQPRLFQLHGSLRRPHTLTRDDYRLWPEQHPRAYRHLEQLVLEKTVLFVGYSLSDPHLDSLLAVVKKITAGREKRLYAWMWRLPDGKAKLLDRRDKIDAVSIEQEEDWAVAFQQLREALNQLSPVVNPVSSGTITHSSTAEPVAQRSFLRDNYLQLMANEWRTLPLEVLDPNTADVAARPLTLEKVYVSLDTTTPRPDELKLKTRNWEAEPPLSAVEAFCHAERQRMVLLGQPGSGKSTFGRYLSLTLTEVVLHPEKVSLTDRLSGWTGLALLPVFLPLRQFSASLTTVTGKGTVQQVTEFIRCRVEERETLRGFGKNLLEELKRQGGLVIFDGLDEVAAEQRLRVKQALEEFVALYNRCRVLVTCRVHSYRQDPAWQLPWEVHTLADFDEAKVRNFIDGWYDALAHLNPASPVNYQNKARSLKAALDPDDPRGLRDLAGIPLLLTEMVFVHTHKELPHSRVGVYRECVDILLMRWQGVREGDVQHPPLLNALARFNVTSTMVHQGLREIAYQSHRSSEKEVASGSGRALVSEGILTGVMQGWLGLEALPVFLEHCRYANGLLLVDQVVHRSVAKPQVLYVFPHLSFEEYVEGLT